MIKEEIKSKTFNFNREIYRYICSHNILNCILLVHLPGRSSPFIRMLVYSTGSMGDGDHTPQLINLA